MNELSFLRWTHPDAESPQEIDNAVPVVDGVPLFEMLGVTYPGVAMTLVAPPSRRLQGEPLYSDDGRAMLVDGRCGIAECCGITARIRLRAKDVVWSDFLPRADRVRRVRLTFNRVAYEAAIAALPDVPVFDYVVPD